MSCSYWHRRGRRAALVLGFGAALALSAPADAHIPVALDGSDWNPWQAPKQVNRDATWATPPGDGVPTDVSGGDLGFLYLGDAPGVNTVRSVQLEFRQGDPLFVSLLIPRADRNPPDGYPLDPETPEMLNAYARQPQVVLISPRKPDGGYQVEAMHTRAPGEGYAPEDAWIHEFCEGFGSDIAYQRLGTIGYRPTQNINNPPDPDHSLSGFVGEPPARTAEVTGTYTVFVYSHNPGWNPADPDASPGRFALSVGSAELPRGTAVENVYLERAQRMASDGPGGLFFWYEQRSSFDEAPLWHRTCSGAPPSGS